MTKEKLIYMLAEEHAMYRRTSDCRYNDGHGDAIDSAIHYIFEYLLDMELGKANPKTEPLKDSMSDQDIEEAISPSCNVSEVEAT
jgi:hypothetical protein